VTHGGDDNSGTKITTTTIPLISAVASEPMAASKPVTKKPSTKIVTGGKSKTKDVALVPVASKGKKVAEKKDKK
jgi:hypothetical protein